MLDLWQNASDEDTQKFGFWDGAAGFGAIGAFLSVAAYHSFEGSLLIDGQVNAAQKLKIKNVGDDYLAKLNPLFDKIANLIPITGGDLKTYMRIVFQQIISGKNFAEQIAVMDHKALMDEKNACFVFKSQLDTFSNASKSGLAAARDASSSLFGYALKSSQQITMVIFTNI